jgi:hypothetical protein
MTTATINELRKELVHVDHERLRDICIRLARYKNDNKELLSYLLYEAHDEPAFVEGVKAVLRTSFEAIESRQAYLVKKTVRKILRMVNKYSRYSGQQVTELELRLCFCDCFVDTGFQALKSQVLSNILMGQVKKIKALLAKLPEDLQYDYQTTLDKLRRSSLN